MKTLVIILIVLFSGGCAMFGSERDYDRGEWHLYASSKEVSQIKRDKDALVKQRFYDQMVLDKLASQPADTKTINGATQGYKGIVHNLSRERANIVIEGPETQSFFLSPGEMTEAFLLPGNYYAVTYLGNRPADKGWNFSVGAEKYTYQRKQVHWYVYYDPLHHD